MNRFTEPRAVESITMWGRNQIVLTLGLAAVVGTVLGCQATTPSPSTISAQERLLPTAGKVYVHWQRLRKLDEHGQIDIEDAMKARRQFEYSRQLARTSDEPTDGWVSQGPTNVGGRTRSLLIDPDNPSIMLAGAVSGGIWRTTDAGLNWTQVGSDMSTLEIGSMVRDPNHSNIIYAGTGEGQLKTLGQDDTGQWIGSMLFGGNGIYKSTNRGLTWTHLSSTKDWPCVTMMAIEKTDRDTPRIFAAGSGLGSPDIWGAQNPINGLLYSDDGGSTWQAPATASDSDPTTNGLEVHYLNSPDGNWLVGSMRSSDYRVKGLYSSDGGSTWQVPTLINANGTSMPMDNAPRIAFCPGPADLLADRGNPGSVVVAIWCQSGNSAGIVYLSRDFGQTYYQVSPVNEIDQTDYWKAQAWISPTATSDGDYILCAGGIDLMRAKISVAALMDPNPPDVLDWEPISNWVKYDTAPDPPRNESLHNLPHADMHPLVADPGYDGVSNRSVWVTNDAGLFFANDIANVNSTLTYLDNPTVGWERRINGYQTTQFFSVAGQMITPLAEADVHGVNMRLIGGLQDNGVLVINSNSNNTTSSNSNTSAFYASTGDGGAVVIDPLNTNTVFSQGTGLGPVWRSRDGGLNRDNWYKPELGQNGSDATMQGNWVAPLIMDLDPSSPRLLVGGFFGTTPKDKDTDMGACCMGSSCEIMSYTDCTDLGSEVNWLGPNTICLPGHCDRVDRSPALWVLDNPNQIVTDETIGACCTDLANANCTVTTLSDCKDRQGRFLGPGSTCDGTPCTSVPGSNGYAWLQIGAKIGDNGWPADPSTAAVGAIAVNPINPAEIWVGMNTGEIYMTSQGLVRPGDSAWPPTWTQMNLNTSSGESLTPARCVTRLVFDTGDLDTTPLWSGVYACFGGFTYDNIYRYPGPGAPEKWVRKTGTGSTADCTPIPGGLPCAPVMSLAIHPEDSDRLYAATNMGLYRSTDAGDNWQYYSSHGPGPVEIDQLAFVRDAPVPNENGVLTASDLTGILVLGTHGRGIWTLDETIPTVYGDLDGDCDVDIEDLLTLIANWGGFGGDVDGDGDTDIEDLLHVIEAWGDICD
ncbi:MAG: hypothetical protein MK116_04200 [Phycisphaerales bacterium]|nr:hypothetical protein [Phycisphaerales bacterium]